MPTPPDRYLPPFIVLHTADTLLAIWEEQGLPRGVAWLIQEYLWVGPYLVSTRVHNYEERRVVVTSP